MAFGVQVGSPNTADTLPLAFEIILDQRAELKLSPFEPTVYIVSTGYSQNGIAVEYSESYYPASRSSFNIEINRGR